MVCTPSTSSFNSSPGMTKLGASPFLLSRSKSLLVRVGSYLSSHEGEHLDEAVAFQRSSTEALEVGGRRRYEDYADKPVMRALALAIKSLPICWGRMRALTKACT